MRSIKKTSLIFTLLFLLLPVSSFGQDGGKLNRQISTGIVNFGYVDHPYDQFSGRSDLFKDGNGPASYFSNVSLQILVPLEDFKYPTGFSYGFELLQFSSDSNSVYTGNGKATGPAITMDLQIWSFTLRAFFADMYESTMQPFFGIGWGWLNGDISSSDTGVSARTNLIGLMTYQTYGAVVKMDENVGFSVELRNLRANSIRASNDPFGQAGGGELALDFSGTMLNFTGYYRF